jgi:biotin carboxyl carrier protein
MRRYAVTLGGAAQPIEVQVQDEPVDATGARRLRVVVGGAERVVELRASGPSRYTWAEGHRIVTAEVEPKGAKLAVSVRGESFVAEVADARVLQIPVVAANRKSGPLVIRAPMPGRLVKVLVKVGDEIKAGQGVVVVEAMKMENELRASRDGKVQEIKVAEGAAVEAGEELLVLA